MPTGDYCLSSALGSYTCDVDTAWYIYYTPAATCTTAGSVTYNNVIWSDWIDQRQNLVTSNVWGLWQQGLMQSGSQAAQSQQSALNLAIGLRASLSQQITPEQAEAAQQAQVREQAEWQRQAEESQKRVEVAESTAERLLVEHLDERQLEQYRNHKYFEVIRDGGKRVYRIKYGWAGNVEVLEGGRSVEKLCIHPRVSVPYCDNLLAQKLLLEADETQFRRIANITKLAA